ncbi:nucleotidyltransferase family protein [Prevotella sp. P2-180]|uniref:nucleotidyltransferase family protein n=1 Tax=Prevotella sp. P2-180 TaxID=2024224 RepID=UPI000B965797|nr:nucleotidyltransferase family protein [Prevotella sp. P2-180]OYP65850.1 hypothetical protein CIK98_08075 [Prevotella sp. P2-180]
MNIFFEFIQIALGNRKSLSVGISDADWLRLFDFCKKQAMIGVGFTAVEKLHTQGVTCPAALRMQWMALALQIETRNALLNEQCAKLARKYEHDGLSTCILKGQGNLLNYPEHLRKRRQCGDIDVWTVCKNGIPIAVQTAKDKAEYVEYHGHKAVIEYVRMQHRLAVSNVSPVIRYHHIEAPKIDGTEVEVHFRPCYAHSPQRNWRMQRWFIDHADVCMKHKTHMGFSVPTASVNVVYQMCHLFSHYFDEGLGLRQLMDYYFALKVWHNDVMECKDLQSQGMWSEGLGTAVMSAQEVMAVIRSFGMGKFASAVMYVLHEVFENEECRMKNEECISSFAPWMICEPNEKEGRKLLEEIMKGGNFGQYDERGKEFKNGGMVKHGLWKLKRVMRLVSSYPEEAMWEPMFRVYHLLWRKKK